MGVRGSRQSKSQSKSQSKGRMMAMRILLTAGPTREPIDAVRFVSNRSSGRLGIALAHAGVDAGHEVTVLLGPVLAPVSLSERCAVERFETCADLQRLLLEHFGQCQLLIMAAAVADYRPQIQPGKLGRDQAVMLRLEPTPDLVAQVAAGKSPRQRVIAFALEPPEQLEHRALAKMRGKGVDAIVGNPLGTMEADEIEPLWLTAGGQRLEPGPMPKDIFARWLVRKAEQLFA